MGLLDDAMASSVGFAMDGDNLGETVTYVPRSGSARTVQASVVRTPPARIQGVPIQVKSAKAEALVLNDASLGVAESEVDTGADKLTVGSVSYAIVDYESNGGIVRLSLR